ncbi:MAG: hypothetical protein APR53_03270 [Methanoculleus sp. SDB]|nr:MAG: hypothetical protein APR53_03270 [Methanoculleus sp. SDB]
MDKCLTLIPARAGSKGIPNKNMALIGSRPLLEFTVRAALGAGLPGRICLSTDSPEMRTFGLSCGIEAPFFRPSELAQDGTGMIPVIEHALAWYDEAEGFVPEYLVLLQPTCPFRSPRAVLGAFRLIENAGSDCLISVNAVSTHPCEYIRETEGGFAYVMEPPEAPGRQNFPEVFFINGAIYICRTDFFRKTGRLFDTHALLYKMDPLESLDIDEYPDLMYAGWFFEHSQELIYWM